MIIVTLSLMLFWVTQMMELLKNSEASYLVVRIYLGHKTGQCHTHSMRDPGQTGDGSRNWWMRQYAAK